MYLMEAGMITYFAFQKGFDYVWRSTLVCELASRIDVLESAPSMSASTRALLGGAPSHLERGMYMHGAATRSPCSDACATLHRLKCWAKCETLQEVEQPDPENEADESY